MLDDSLQLVYSCFSHARLFLLLNFFWCDKIELLSSVSGNDCALKKHVGRNNTHSVFDVNLEAKPSEVVVEVGDQSFDVGPGFKNKRAVIYIDN